MNLGVMQNKFQHKLVENNLSKKPYTIFEKKKIHIDFSFPQASPTQS